MILKKSQKSFQKSHNYGGRDGSLENLKEDEIKKTRNEKNIQENAGRNGSSETMNSK